MERGHRDPAGDGLRRVYCATVESVRATLVGKDLIAADELETALAACRAHLADPETVFTTYTVSQVWGRRAGGAAET